MPVVTQVSTHAIGAQDSALILPNRGNPITDTGSNNVFVTDGYNGVQMLELVEGNVGGLITVAIQGSFDGQNGSNWYAVGYYRVDGQAVLTRAVATVGSPFSIAQNNTYVLQLVDAYPYVRLNFVTNNGSVTARIYVMGV